MLFSFDIIFLFLVFCCSPRSAATSFSSHFATSDAQTGFLGGGGFRAKYEKFPIQVASGSHRSQIPRENFMNLFLVGRASANPGRTADGGRFLSADE